MKYIKYHPLVFITLIALFAGCSKSYLDLKPIATPTEVSYYKDSSSIDATVTAAYAELCAREVFDKDYYLVIGSIPSDDVDCGGQNLSDYPMAQHFDQFTHSLVDNTPTEEIWDYCYKGLREVNTVLEKIPLVQTNYPKAISASLASRRTGEMEFLRAWYHFTLVQVFGGVPIANKVIQPSDFSKPRNTIKEVFSFIEADLKDAITKLPGRKELAAQDIGRATRGAAQSLLARMLIYESSYAENYPSDDRFKGCLNRYQGAFTNAVAVINSGDYDLVNGGTTPGTFISSWRFDMKPYDGYRWLFTTDGDNSSEGIFEIQNVQDKGGYGITRGNVLTVYTTCRWLSVSGTQTAGDGWSFNCPTQYLVDAFKNSDARETGLHSAAGLETDDPRFATTVGRVGDSIFQHNILKRMDLSNIPSQMIGRKFECGYAEMWSDGSPAVWESPMNIRLIRYAEVILIAAEAAIKINDQASALTYVNMIRTRARNSGVTGFPKDLTAVSFEDIVHERRLEFTLEPHRFFDLVRWNLTGKYINGIAPDAGTLGNFTVEFIPGKHEFWPIPLTQIQLSKGGLVNYPAWQ